MAGILRRSVGPMRNVLRTCWRHGNTRVLSHHCSSVWQPLRRTTPDPLSAWFSSEQNSQDDNNANNNAKDAAKTNKRRRKRHRKLTPAQKASQLTPAPLPKDVGDVLLTMPVDSPWKASTGHQWLDSALRLNQIESIRIRQSFSLMEKCLGPTKSQEFYKVHTIICFTVFI